MSRRIINKGHPLLKGAAAWWRVMPWTAGGSLFVDLLGRCHATRATPAWQGAAGRPGGHASLSFNGSGDSCTLTRIPEGSVFSLFFWAYQTAQSGYRAIYANSSPTGFYLNGGKADWYLGGDHFGTTTLSANTWYHSGATYDGTTMTFYVNGLSDGTSVFSPQLPGTGGAATPKIGIDGGGNNFGGYLDDLLILTRAWSAAEVAAYYVLSHSGYEGLECPRRSRVVAPAAAARLAPEPYVVGQSVVNAVSY